MFTDRILKATIALALLAGCAADEVLDELEEQREEAAPVSQPLLSLPIDCSALPNDGVGSGIDECDPDDGRPGGGGGIGGGGNPQGPIDDYLKCVDVCLDGCPIEDGWPRWKCIANCWFFCGGNEA